jgi:hypothetical protein
MLVGCKPSYACVIIIEGLLKGLVALLNIYLINKNWSKVHMGWRIGTKILGIESMDPR